MLCATNLLQYTQIVLSSLYEQYQLGPMCLDIDFIL